jgi:hypothetical protein
MDPNNLKLKDVVVASAPTIGLISGIIFISNGYTVIGSFILVPAILVFAFSFYKMPYKEMSENLAQRETEKTKTSIGRVQLVFEKVLDYVGNLYIIFIICLCIWWYFIK